jgi:Ca2+-binding RTX toxin-like protein
MGINMATIDGTAGNDVLQGRWENDDIWGLEGDDRLYGGDGDDFAFGSLGDDLIDGEAGNDNLAGGDGVDRILGGDGQDMLRGHDGDDSLIGGAGNDYLSGGAGVDSYNGGTDEGYDRDSVSMLGDRVSLYDVNATEGAVADLRTGIVENDGFGNRERMVDIESLGGGTLFADRFYGNDAANLLWLGTADTVVGFGGDDYFIVDGAGALDGGDGVDTIRVFESSKTVADANGDGMVDTVYVETGVVVDLVAGTFTDGFGDAGTIVGIENLAGTYGTYEDTLLGDDQDNVIRAFAGADIVDGRGGSDTISYASDDPYAWRNSQWGGVEVDLAAGYSEETALKAGTVDADTPRFGRDGLTSIENIVGGSLGDRLLGDGGDNVIATGAGADYVNGRAGNDTLTYADARAAVWADLGANLVEEWGTGETRFIEEYDADRGEYRWVTVDADDGLGHVDRVHGMENLVGTAFGDRLAGDAALNRIHGGDGKDRIYWSGGGDTLDGQAGNDLFDLSKATAGARVDLNAGTATVARLADTEQLIGFESVEGSSRNDDISGTRAANWLDGAGGIDRLVGRGGNDTYLVDDSRDLVVELAGEGVDTVISDADYVLGAEVENLILEGSNEQVPVAGTGNELANRITGNWEGNRLDGRAGADTLIGGEGNDIYVVDTAGDRIVEAPGEGTDRVRSTIDYTLGSTLDHLTLLGLDDLAGTGNVRGNQITGNAGDNRIMGEQGRDTLFGAAGDDVLGGGSGRDSLRGGAGRDTFLFDGRFDDFDRILAFDSVDDRIALDQSLFTGLAETGTLRLAAFREGAEAQDESDRILYDQATGKIFYDADGAGGAKAILFASVLRGTEIVASDFVVVA